MNRLICKAIASGVLLCLSAAAQAAVPRLEMPLVDVAATLAQDALKPGPQPFRFAVPIPVAISPAAQGQWNTAADGSAVWQLRVHSAKASSLNFGFIGYQLPPGATLRISAVDGSDALGPYSSEHNAQGQLWTPVLRSSEALLELRVPAAARNAVTLSLGFVNHGFRGFGAQDNTSAKSGSCNIDVVCADGNEWRNEIRSVARYTIAGALLCTGQLVNNSAQDLKPYFLTANHCLPLPVLAPTTVFYWNYQTSRCGGTPDGSLDQTQSGALYLAGSGGATDVGADFTLLQLLTTPPAAFKVYYAGWDNRDIAPVGVTGIHHPNGDEKRISMDFGATVVTAYAQQAGTLRSMLTPTHLMVPSWDRGVTEGGSSGSGLWNREHRLVGQLSGGSSSCDTPSAPDWYGRMHANFFDLDTPLTSPRSWLDPRGGTQVLDGIDPSRAPAVPPSSGGGLTPAPGNNPASASTATAGGGGAWGSSALLLLALAALRRRALPQA